MNPIATNNSKIVFNNAGYSALNKYVKKNNFSSIFVLVDSNTNKYCLPHFLKYLNIDLPIEIIEIEPGEIHKTIETCSEVWHAISELGADRKSLMINLGGGVITDLGGFVACTFKRGIKYINVPTSLLAMVDASVGGKTGVDLGTLKNQIGVISSGDLVLIDSNFLKTLPENQFNSGIAEMLKHGLITSDDYWSKMVSYLSDGENLDELIYESIQIKSDVVTEDPNEEGLRKTLNFGHTLGHAIESYFLNSSRKKELLHGEAIAVGMILATFISHKQLGFPIEKRNRIKEVIIKLFNRIDIAESDYERIMDLMKYDKKNHHGNIYFVLLSDIGKPKLDCIVDNNLIVEAFNFYRT